MFDQLIVKNMTKNFIILITILLSNFVFAQKNFIDTPYLETSAKADTLVTPDKIYISITLKESDSKNKQSVEDLENKLEQTLSNLNIDIKNNLKLLDYSSNFKEYFLKGQNILKSKVYSLIVENAQIASKVLVNLEDVGISNVNIEKTEYSKASEVILDLKSKAIIKSKIIAEKLTNPLGQKVGKALYISDNNSVTNSAQGNVLGYDFGLSNIYGNRSTGPLYVEFEKLQFEVQVDVKYALE